MTSLKLTLFAAAAIGAASIGGASALPMSNISAALGENHVQDVRVVCGQYGRCYNTRRGYRYARPYGYARGYYAPNYNTGYYGAPGYGYYGRRGVGIGIGPFGFGVW